MADPLLRVRASGLGGSGYAIPTRRPDGSTRPGDDKGKPLVVPGVTTVLGALEKGGVVQWAVDNTAAYAVANAQALADRDEDWGFKYLRYYHTRKPDFDDPAVDLHNYSAGVLSDLAEQGTLIHENIEAFINDDFGPPFTRVEQEEAFEAFLEWVDANDVEFLDCETTVMNPDHGYAGTLDLKMRYRGKLILGDTKTSRKVHDSHLSQVSALFHAPIEMVQDDSGVEYKSKGVSTRWVEREAPKYDGIAILQVRPRTIDDYGNEIPAFCKLHEIDNDELGPGMEEFLGALQVRRAQKARKDMRRERENRDYF